MELEPRPDDPRRDTVYEENRQKVLDAQLTAFRRRIVRNYRAQLANKLAFGVIFLWTLYKVLNH
jgi:hypothetical protein